jgi:hypothetical protein
MTFLKKAGLKNEYNDTPDQKGCADNGRSKKVSLNPTVKPKAKKSARQKAKP